MNTSSELRNENAAAAAPRARNVAPLRGLTWLRVEVISALASWLLRLWCRSLRWEVLEPTAALNLDTRTTPGIFAGWHDQQLLSWYAYRKHHRHFSLRGEERDSEGSKFGVKGIVALTSRHADGQIIARTLHRFGFRTAAGSSSRGGVAGLHALVTEIRGGFDIAITPDGPRGPRHLAKDGVTKLAQLTGAPVYPIAVGAQRCWRAGSWDKMFLPWPFSRVRAVIGEPVLVPRRLTPEQLAEYTAAIQRSLAVATERVNQWQESR